MQKIEISIASGHQEQFETLLNVPSHPASWKLCLFPDLVVDSEHKGANHASPGESSEGCYGTHAINF